MNLLRSLTPTRLAAAATLFASASAFAGSPAAASEKSPVAPAKTESPWEVTASAGLSLAQGNNDNLQLNAEILASYITLKDELYLDAAYLYSQDQGATTGNSFHASANYNRLLNERFYVGLFSDFLHDELADIDYRVSVGPNLGYYLIKNDTTKLALEFGAGYLWEKQDAKDDYFTLRFAQRFEHKLASRIKLVESVVYEPKADDFGNYLLTAEAGISFAISQHWAIKASVRERYDSTPAAGADPNDLAVLASLSYSLAGFTEDAPAKRRSLKPDKKKDAAPAMGWTNTAAIGFGLTSGNSQTLTLTADYATAFRSETHEIFFNIGGAYGENNDSTNVQNFRTSAQYNRLFTDRLYAGATIGFLYDEIANLDYQVSPAVVGGVYLVKTDRTKLSVDAGPGYVWKKVGGEKDDYFTVQFSQKLSVKLADNLSFNESVTYSPDISDFGNYTLNAAATVDVDLTAKLSFRTGVTDIYDSSPAAGSKKNDLLLTSGLAVKF